MAGETLSKQVRRLEHRVEMLEELPARMDAMESQILPLRGEVQGEFSALRTEMHALNAETIRVVETLHVEAKQHAEKLNAETVRHMHELNAETRRHMLVLHEEVIDRLKRLGEGGDSTS